MRHKLLFLIESLSGGGAEKVLSTLLQHLDYSKFEVTLCCVSDIGKYMEEVKTFVHYTSILPNPSKLKGWKKFIYKIQYKFIYNWLPLKWVYQWFVPHHADVEIAFVEGFATKLLSHSTNHKAKKIAWVHTDLIKNHWISIVYKNHQEELSSYLSFYQIIGVSQAACDSINQLYNLSSKVTLLYNPIDSEYIKEQADKNITPKLSPQEPIRIVSIGRLVPVKAYSRLLRIIAKLNEENHPIELWLLGDGEERSKLKQYIKEHQLESIVKLWGFQSNPYAYLAQCDLFVCSSISEGYSTAVTEALILGIPVITTDCSGMDELLKGGKYGIITENSEEALYKGLKQLLDNTTQLQYYKEKAIERGKDFSLEKLMEPIEKLFSE